ncbi:MAG: 30S ribosomal protein S20 [Acidimicrobiia bacterium]
MANIKSQIKRNRSNERRRLRNQGVRSELKTRTKNAKAAIDNGDDNAADTVRIAQSRINKAGAKGRIHKNAAARRTSRLMKHAVKADR